jgi:small-conductance mechanosensitive channel
LLKEILEFNLFPIGDFELKVFHILFSLCYLIGVYFFLRIVKLSIYKVRSFDVAKKFSIYKLTKYIVWVFAIISGLQMLDVNMTIVLGGFGALLVGFGLGMQNLFSDYISGVIILADSSIKFGDIIEVNGIICKVVSIKLRTTTVFTRDDRYIILPNTDLTRNPVINWTNNTTTCRFDVGVGVDYKSDVALVMKLMQETASLIEKIKSDPKPVVRFSDFGNSSLDFNIYFWSDELFRIESIKSEYRVKLFEAFAKNNVSIPFPQRVLHFPNPVSKTNEE